MSSVSAALRRLLHHRHRAAQMLILTVGVAAYGLGLKLDRIRVQTQPPMDLWPVLQATADLAFAIGWVVVWMWALSLARSSRGRTITFALAQVLSLVLALLTFFYHEYSIRTGTSLSWALISSSLSNSGEFDGIVGSQFTPDAVARLTLGLLLVLVVPFVLAPVVTRLLARMERRPQGDPARPVARLSRFVAPAVVLACVLGSAWSAPTASAQFSRAPLTNIILGAIQAAQPAPSVTATPTPTEPDASLLGADGKDLNVVVITLETQRATDALPETTLPVTPVLDELRATSLVAESGYTVVPHTSKALTAIQCGVAPPIDRKNTEANPDGLMTRCLPELLDEVGYQTAFFQSATENFERRRLLASNLGYEHFESVDSMDTSGFSKANYFGYEDDILLEPSREWVESVGDDPFLLTYLTVSAHHDYTLPDIPTIDFVNDPTVNAYLNGVHYQDAFVGHVIDMFKELGLYDDTVFVIAGDHGEGFGEHGIGGHDHAIYEEGLRIPLMVHAPKWVSPAVFEGPIQQTTVPPTVLDILGYALEDSPFQEQSLLDEPDGTTVNASCLDPGNCIAQRDGDYKYIHFFGDRSDMVFDLVNDPGETVNIINEMDPEWVTAHRASILQWYWTEKATYAQRDTASASPSATPSPTGSASPDTGENE